MKFEAKKIVSYIGSAVMLVALGFIVRRLMNYGIDFSLLTSPAVVVGLIGVAVAEGVVLFFAALNFRAIIKNTSGVTVDKPVAVHVYLTSNIYKYIPGGVMYVAGRHRIAVETEGLGHAKIMLSTVFESVFVVLAALILAFMLAFDSSTGFLYYAEFWTDIVPLAMLILGIACVVIAPPAYIFREKIKGFFSTVKIFSPLVLVKRFGFAFFLMLLWGMTFLVTIMLLGQEVSPTLAATIVGMYLLAWLSGFLVPGAPSGLGVREAVMMVALGGIVYVDILLAAMVIHRVITVGGDLFGYLLAVIYDRYTKFNEKART